MSGKSRIIIKLPYKCAPKPRCPGYSAEVNRERETTVCHPPRHLLHYSFLKDVLPRSQYPARLRIDYIPLFWGLLDWRYRLGCQFQCLLRILWSHFSQAISSVHRVQIQVSGLWAFLPGCDTRFVYCGSPMVFAPHFYNWGTRFSQNKNYFLGWNN